MRHTLFAVLATVIVALVFAMQLAPAAHAAPPSGARPYSGSSTLPWCIQWHIMPSPQASGTYSFLSGVAACAANDIWAVGSATSPDGSVTNTLIEHYNGTAWSIVSSPSNCSDGGCGGW